MKTPTRFTTLLCMALLLAIACFQAPARAEVYPGAAEVIGHVAVHAAIHSDSMMELARRYKLGYEEMRRANPSVDPFAPEVGAELVIPTQWVVPSAARSSDGIFINLSELRLYYAYHYRGRRLMATFPVGIGQEGWETPVGRFEVVEKLENPAWYVPKSIRESSPDLPGIVPPGPGNPLGTHALRLSGPSLLIHGTSRPWGVGSRVSHGCIRLYPEDISRLFVMAPVGTPVHVVREPVRIGTRGNRVYVAALRDPLAEEQTLGIVLDRLADNGLLSRVDHAKLRATLAEVRGLTMDVSP